MNLNNALKLIHNTQEIPSDWTIRFWDMANTYYGHSLPTTINIDALYSDWYGDCNHCPENGELVYGIEINQESTGKLYIVETKYDFTFEELMMAIEKEFYKN